MIEKKLLQKKTTNNTNNLPFVSAIKKYKYRSQHKIIRLNPKDWIEIINNRRSLLTKIISKRSNKLYVHDFRFLIPLAHRLMEQGGYERGNVELNNPYYLRSSGDLGFSTLEKIEKDGYTKADFGNFSTEEKGSEAYINQLEINEKKDRETWLEAYNTILNGGSFQSFIRGLQPDGNTAYGKNYSTKYTYFIPDNKKNKPIGKIGTMMKGMSKRLRELITDFIVLNKYEINLLKKEIKNEEDIYYVIDVLDIRINFLIKDNILLHALLSAIIKDGFFNYYNLGVNVQQQNNVQRINDLD